MRRIVMLLIAGAVLLACEGGDDTGPGAAASTSTTVSTATTSASEATAVLATTETTTSVTATTAVPTTAATPTTMSQPAETAEAATAFAERGPYPVGVTTYQLAKGPLVEVWYPAAPGTTGTVAYDVRDFTPPAVKDLLTADVPATYSYAAARDADAADGSFPVVLLSHGFSGFRVYASFLASHLASHGMVVAAPDHPSRDLVNVLGGTATGDRADSVDDLLQALDLVLAEGATPGGRLEGRVDGERVAAIGHSAGGATVLGAAQDPHVDGYVAMAAGGPPEGTRYPPVPSFFVAGAVDRVVPAAERTRPAFDAAPAPSTYWEIAATGHNGFDDLCTLGGGTGVIGVAEAAGLGALLDAQPQLRTLGEDGCLPPAAPVDQAHPIIRHGVTAWLRWLFGDDVTPVGLDQEAASGHELDVTVAQR